MISLGLAVGTAGLAIGYGDQAARSFGALFLANWLASLAVDNASTVNTGLGVFCVDGATLVCFIWASLRTRRVWTLVATAFMALIVASHVATAIDFRVTINTFRLSMALWSYGIMACVGFGAWRAWRARRRTLAPVAP
jgi:ABC-type transport system involved in cytochrome c biogenesis permease subunit